MDHRKSPLAWLARNLTSARMDVVQISVRDGAIFKSKILEILPHNLNQHFKNFITNVVNYYSNAACSLSTRNFVVKYIFYYAIYNTHFPILFTMQELKT